MNHKGPLLAWEGKFHWFYRKFIYGRKFKKFGKGSFVSPFSEIINMHDVAIGNNVTVLHSAWIVAIRDYMGEKFEPEIVIGDNTYIGHGATLSCANKLILGSDVTIGDNVYISDNSHGYEDVTRNIYKQKLKVGTIKIGDRSWIGKNAVIAHNVEIGEHSVVGANSFVGKSVPPFTVVSGNPAVPIKKYDFESKHWVKV